MDGIFPLFPYLLLYRTEEVEGSNPARSTAIPNRWGDIFITHLHAGVGVDVWSFPLFFVSARAILSNIV
jgi:hypothetical protein